MTADRVPPPASAAWREGDAVGNRQFVDLSGPIALEAGATLPGVRVAYETWGTPNADRSNAVLVLHALTGDSHVAGAAGPGHATAGWWDTLVGPGKPIDTDVWWVVAPNVLGGCQGTTGPSSPAPDGKPWGSRFPFVTVRDQVAVEASFADALGVRQWACVVGGSMGGMRSLEWAVTHPERLRSVVVLACGAYATAEQIALCAAQIQAIRADPRYSDGDYYDAAPGEGPHVGMGIARRLAHISYRSEEELAERFGRLPQEMENPFLGGRYAVESYLDHHADKLAHRFDANSYVVLSQAMNSHDVGRGRGGVAEALARITAQAFVAGIDSDRLYPLYLQQEIAEGVSTCRGLEVISSPYGHDGFLLESDDVGAVIAEALSAAGRVARPGLQRSA